MRLHFRQAMPSGQRRFLSHGISTKNLLGSHRNLTPDPFPRREGEQIQRREPKPLTLPSQRRGKVGVFYLFEGACAHRSSVESGGLRFGAMPAWVPEVCADGGAQEYAWGGCRPHQDDLDGP